MMAIDIRRCRECGRDVDADSTMTRKTARTPEGVVCLECLDAEVAARRLGLTARLALMRSRARLAMRGVR